MRWKWRDAYRMMGWNQNDSWMTDWHWEGGSGTGMMGWLLNEVKMIGCLQSDGMKSKWLGMNSKWGENDRMTYGCLWKDGMKSKWLLNDGLTLWGWEWHWDDGMTSKWGKNDRMPTEWWDEIKMTPGWRTDVGRVRVALGGWDDF